MTLNCGNAVMVANSLSVAEVFVIYGGLIIAATAVSFLFFKDLRKTSY